MGAVTKPIPLHHSWLAMLDGSQAATISSSQGIWDVRAGLSDACAAALAVAAGILMQFELRLTGTYGVLSSILWVCPWWC